MSINLTFSDPAGQTFKLKGTNVLTPPLATWPVLESSYFGVGAPEAINFTDMGATNGQMFCIIAWP